MFFLTPSVNQNLTFTPFFMIIKYGNQHLDNICNDERVANRVIGKFSAKKLKRIMTYLDGAINFVQIKADSMYGFHGLKGDRYGQYSMDLNGGARITFYFLNEPDTIVIEDNTATTVQVAEITNYHR